MPSHWADVATSLADLIAADDAFRDVADDGTEVPVFFGPALWWASADKAFVVVADSGEPDQISPAGTLTQEPGPIGAGLQTYDEAGQVDCLAVTQAGDGDTRAALVACASIVDAVHALLRATPDVNLGTALLTVRFMQAAPTMFATKQGVVAEIPFTVAYKARWRTP
jgi:hypothetical protein